MLEKGIGRLSIPPAPLLGGGIVLYAEMLALGRYSSAEIEVYVDKLAGLPDSNLASSISALSKLDRMTRVSLVGTGHASNRLVADFRGTTQGAYYEGSNPVFDTPESLLDLTDVDLLNLIKFDSKVTERAFEHLDGGNQSVLCVHANSVQRPSTQQKCLSKGDEDEWVEGLRAAVDQGVEMSILFIGSDSERLAAKLRRPGNVISPLEDFATELACIRFSTAFLGMSSGPSAIAMFSTTPYIVFKDASHHPEQMERVLRDGRYPFSLPSQRILRTYPNRRAIEEACFALAGEKI